MAILEWPWIELTPSSWPSMTGDADSRLNSIGYPPRRLADPGFFTVTRWHDCSYSRRPVLRGCGEVECGGRFFITILYFPAAPVILIVGCLSPDGDVFARALGAAPSSLGILVATRGNIVLTDKRVARHAPAGGWTPALRRTGG